jgi:transcriptional regulator with XRE-family HTH domain
MTPCASKLGRLRFVRFNSRLTIHQLAAHFGMSFSRYETIERTEHNITTSFVKQFTSAIKALANIDCNPDWIMNGTGDAPSFKTATITQEEFEHNINGLLLGNESLLLKASNYSNNIFLDYAPGDVIACTPLINSVYLNHYQTVVMLTEYDFIVGKLAVVSSQHELHILSCNHQKQMSTLTSTINNTFLPISIFKSHAHI